MISINFYINNLIFQNQIVEFTWKTIKCWEVDEANGLFTFQFQREDKSPKCVKLHTPYVSIIIFVKKNYLTLFDNMYCLFL